MTKFVPRPYQHQIRNFIFDNPRCNVFASPGMGKTSSTVAAFAELKLFGEAKKLLVLAPKRVAESAWPAEREKWRESFGHLTMASAVGTAEQRLAALRSNPDILTTNYENVEWLLGQCSGHWPFDMVVADESTRLKGLRVSLQPGRARKDGTTGESHLRGQGSTRAKALAHIAHKHVRRWVNLTGSPAPNGVVDVWGQQWFVDGGRRLGNSFDAFSQRWFRAVPGSSREQQRIEPMPYAQEQIQALLAQTSITVDARDWFDIQQPIEKHILVDLPPRARKMYDEMQRELFTWIGEHPLEAFSAGTKALKCLQIASGSVIHDTEGAWAPVHDEKIEALKSIVEETNGEPLLVAYQFRADLERILKAFPKARTLEKDSDRTIRDFQAGKLPMLVVHPAGAGHGLDLQHQCRTLVDYSTGFNLEYDEQVIERIGPTRQAQIGKKCAVFRYRIVARDTIEQTVVIPRLTSKATVQDAIKAAMKKPF